MRYREIINELFNQAVPWKLLHSDDVDFNAEFHIDDAHFIFHGFQDNGGWHVQFKRNDAFAQSHTGNQFAVFATVKEILEKLLTEKQPTKFHFSADLEEQSRVKLYRRMAQQLGTKYGYQVEEMEGLFKYYFTLRKNKVNESVQLNELFNQVADWNTVRETDKYFEAEFDIGESHYVFEAETFGKKWEVAFSNNQEMGLTGTGREFEVFATIRDIMDHFLVKYDPEQFFFSASMKEASRVSLYKRMATQICKTYGYHLLSEHKGQYKEQWFTFMKDGAHSEIQ